MKDQVTDAAIAATAKKFAIGGGGVAFFGGISANQVAAYGGLLVAILGLGVQWYYKRKEDRRREERHRLHVQHKLLTPYEDDADV